MNNLNHLRDACFKITHDEMNYKLRNLLSNWLNMSIFTCTSRMDLVRPLHSVKYTDETINTIFPGTIIYYSTVIIGRVRFTTTDYARNKAADDSSIFFQTGSELSFGRIRRIFTVNDAQPIFHVDVIPNMVNFKCSSLNDTYSYSDIQSGSYDEQSTSVFISSSNIIEKCVFFERPNKYCTFYRFPNLQESS